MSYLYYSALFALLYVFLGLGLTVLITPERLRKYILFISPLIGYCYLTLGGALCFDLDLRGSDVYAPLLVVPPAILLLYTLSKRRNKLRQLVHIDLLFPTLIGISCFLIVSIPLILNTDRLEAMSLGNNDIALYASASRYLKEFPESEPIGFLASAGPGYLFKFVFGAPLATGVASSLLLVETHRLQNIAVHVFFLFGVLIFHTVAQEVFGYKRAAAAATLLYGINPLMYYTAYHGFQPQIIATALTLCLFLVHAVALETPDGQPQIPRSYILLAALLNWGILITYAHMLPPIYIVLLCYWLAFVLPTESRQRAINWGVLLLASLLISILVSPSRASSLVSFFFHRAGTQEGWHVPLLSPGTVLGFTLDRPDLNDLTSAMGFVVVGVSTAVIFLGLIDTLKKDRKLLMYAASTLSVITAGYVILAYPGETVGRWGGYKSYKLLSFFLPFLLLVSLSALRGLKFNHTLIRFVPLACLLVLLSGNAISCYYVVKLMYDSSKVLSNDLVDLQRVEADPSVRSINILESNTWDTMWKAHFLMRKELFFEVRSPYREGDLLGDWNLKWSKQSGREILNVVGFDQIETIAVNSSYELEWAGYHKVLHARFGTGWHESEITHRWTGLHPTESSIVLVSSTEHLSVALDANYWALDRDNSLSIYLNRDLVAECPGKESCNVDRLVLLEGENIVEFKSAMPARVPETGGQRELGYAFTSIEVRPASLQDKSAGKSLHAAME